MDLLSVFIAWFSWVSGSAFVRTGYPALPGVGSGAWNVIPFGPLPTTYDCRTDWFLTEISDTVPSRMLVTKTKALSLLTATPCAPNPVRIVLTTLPLATLMPDYRTGAEAALPQATLGALAPQAPTPQTLMQRLGDASPQERRRWMLWAVLAAAVAGLAWLARGLLRDVKAGARPDA